MQNEPQSRDPAQPTRPEHGGVARRIILAAGGGLAIAALGVLFYEFEMTPAWLTGERIQHTAASSGNEAQFSPPADASIPDDEFGAAVRRGREIFTNTGTAAADHVGNGLACSNCHLDGGRQPLSAPMWAAWVTYPKYRSKNKQINTMEDRVMGCFNYSMNAPGSPSRKAPPHGDDIYRDLETYFYWLATGAPTNTKLEGVGFGSVKKPAGGYDLARGSEVFAANCAVCHGADGQGQRDINGRTVFPPLWGPNSFNWGAGMARIDTAAAFVKHNMPLSQPGKLTDQEAWDVAAYLDSHERPKDPRQKGTVEENRNAHHDGDETFYGRMLNGVLIGVGTGDRSAEAGK